MHLVVLAFIGVRSYKHTIYCAMRLVLPYVFLFVFCIARSRTVWVTVIFKAWFLIISYFLYCVQNIFSFGFIKAFDSKQICARTCKDCVMSREINTRYVIFSINQLAKGFSQICQMTGNMQGLPLFINRVTAVMLTITAQYRWFQ